MDQIGRENPDECRLAYLPRRRLTSDCTLPRRCWRELWRFVASATTNRAPPRHTPNTPSMSRHYLGPPLRFLTKVNSAIRSGTPHLRAKSPTQNFVKDCKAFAA